MITKTKQYVKVHARENSSATVIWVWLSGHCWRARRDAFSTHVEWGLSHRPADVAPIAQYGVWFTQGMYSDHNLCVTVAWYSA